MSARLARLVHFFKDSKALVETPVKLKEFMLAASCSSTTTPTSSMWSSDERLALDDMRQLSAVDLGFWVTTASARLYDRNPQEFRPQDHLLRVSDMKGSEGTSERWTAALSKKKIGCCTFLEAPHCSITAFVLSRGVQLDLHDHPTMTIWQKCMLGPIDVFALDWKKNSAEDHSVFPTKENAIVVHTGEVHVGCQQVILPNSGGVLHRMRNLSHHAHPCVFFDIICPPYYAEPHNIQCGYYSVSGVARDGEGVALPEVGQSVTVVKERSHAGHEMEVFIPIL